MAVFAFVKARPGAAMQRMGMAVAVEVEVEVEVGEARR